ncbi:MAG: hypothetical protein WA102_00475 [Candidatus Methanoperedens sp.]
MFPKQPQRPRNMRLYRFAKGCNPAFNGQVMKDTARLGRRAAK